MSSFKHRKTYRAGLKCTRFEAAWAGDLGKIKHLTLDSWDPEHSELPWKIAVNDGQNNPFSLAYSRGHLHVDVAREILEIAQAQYCPEGSGLVSTKAKSYVKPLDFLSWSFPKFVFKDGKFAEFTYA